MENTNIFCCNCFSAKSIGLDQYLDMQGLTFQLKSHKTKPVDTEKMYENLMTRIGPDSWSTNFAHNEFYKYEDKVSHKILNKMKIM